MQRDKKIGLGCATLIMAILLCKFVFGPHPVPQTADATTPVPTPTTQAIATPTPVLQPSPTAQQAVQPTPTPTSAPVPQLTPTTQVPVPQPTQPPTITYDTNSVGGSKVYNPSTDFCDSSGRTCVSTFWTDTRGYVIQCANRKYSHSGGTNGACSRDGKVVATVYQHG